MTEEWRHVAVRDLALGIFDGPHATPPPASEGPFYLGIDHVTPENRLDLSSPRHIAQEDFADWTRRVVPRGDDVVFSYEATLHRYAMIPEGFIGCLGRRMALVRPDPARVVPRFLYYSFLGPVWRAVVEGNVIRGSTVERIPLKSFPGFTVAVPSLDVQRRIANVLGTIDDLVENNLRRIRVLEVMAQAQWTRVEKAATQRQPLCACADFLSGGTPSKAQPEYWQGAVPWVSSRELTRMRLQDTELHVTEEGADAGSRVVPANTILAVVRGMSLATEFRIGLTSRAMAFNQDLKAIVPRVGLDGLVLFHALRAQRDQIRGRATEAAHGTKKLDSDVLGKVMIPVPGETEQRAFRECVAPIHDLWDRLERSNNTLRKLRDLLLPKLLSGGIDVSRLPLPPEELVGSFAASEGSTAR